MALLEIHWQSQTLAKQVEMNVILPDAGDGPFATFYLLHGLSGDHTMWLRRTRIEWYVRNLPLIVVMPDGYRGFYTNNNDGPAYADFFANELPEFIERTLPAKRTRKGRCVGGLSMGGYGALRLALGYPDRFVSANSHSGVLMAGETGSRGIPAGENRRVFGAHPKGTAHDLLALAKSAQDAKMLPQMLIDCGTEDHLIEDSRKFHAGLEKLGVPHQYDESPGDHEWDYWDLHIRAALAFHSKALKLKRSAQP